MNKIFFSGFLTTVAIGGGVLSAQTTQAPAFAQLIGICVTATLLQPNCSISNAGIQCNAYTAGLTIGLAFNTRNSPLLCAVPLKRP